MLSLQQFDAFLMESQWLSRGRIETWQRQQLSSLLRHAQATVPFYRFRLNGLFRRDGTVDWDRWTDLPVLTRKDLSAHFEQLKSRRPIADHALGVELTSTGSTGTPIRFVPTGWMLATGAACIWRSSRWQGVDWSRTMVARHYLEQPDKAEGDSLGPWGPSWDPRSRQGTNIYTSYKASFDQFYEIIQQVRPSYINASNAGLEEVARLNRLAQTPVAAHALFARGAAVTETLTEMARDSFGAKVIDLYSSKEGGSMAHRCAEEGCWHLNEEVLLLEIVDEKGQPVPKGQEGKVVITPFASSFMPLIRYELGDVAIAGEPCPCGRSLATLQQVSGRITQMFRHPDTQALVTWVPLPKLQPMLHVSRWQVAQVAPTRFEVRLERVEPFPEDQVSAFAAAFRAATFPTADVRIVYGADLSPGPGDKFMEYRNEWLYPPVPKSG